MPPRENALSFGIDKVLLLLSPAFMPLAPASVIIRYALLHSDISN